MEGLFDTDTEDMNNRLIDRFDKLLSGIEGLDMSVDYLSAVMTGTSPLSIQTGQKALGRFAKPATRGPTAGIKEDANAVSLWKAQLEEAITSLYDDGYKAEEIREMIDSTFGVVMEEVLDEKKLTAAETEKKEKLAKKNKPALKSMQKQYGEKKGKDVYYGWVTNRAKKEA